MKTHHAATPVSEFTEDDVRAYAYHLYEQSGCIEGHDLDNWLEAKACLEANIPRHQSRTRLHEHLRDAAAPESSANLHAVA